VFVGLEKAADIALYDLEYGAVGKGEECQSNALRTSNICMKIVQNQLPLATKEISIEKG